MKKRIHKPKSKDYLVNGKIPIRAYRTLTDAKTRCYNKNKHNYHRYGGRGITVCTEWLNSSDSFWKDMGPTYKEGLTLDRIDNNKGYSKDNCRWTTPKVQARNRVGKTNRLITINGVTLHLIEWIEKLGLNYNTVRHRLYIKRFSPEKALYLEGEV